jgi:hypothetical protein
VGQVFMRGPKPVAFGRDAVAQLICYIHRNPVRAGVVADPANNDWTSHRAYLGLDPRPSWLDIATGLELAAETDPAFADPAVLCDWIARSLEDRESLDRMQLYPTKRGRPPLVERSSSPTRADGARRAGGAMGTSRGTG